jgi:hypothetical protein
MRYGQQGRPSRETVLDLFPAPLGEAYFEQDREVLAEGKPVKDLLELHLYVRGEAGWCITNKLPVEDEGGTITGLIGISKDLHVQAHQAQRYKELAESIRFIQTHYNEFLKVEQLARMSLLSEYQYEHRMKKLFHMTAGQFITKTRVEAACQLLRSTEGNR